MSKEIITALIEFKNPNFNFYKNVPEHVDIEEQRLIYYRMMHGVQGGQYQEEKCEDVRFMSKEVRPWNNDQVKKYLDKYFADLKNKGVNPYCSNIKALSSWVDRQFSDYQCDWEYTNEHVKDMLGNSLQVGMSHGEKFVLINVERTKIWFTLGHKVRGCNDGQYGKNTPSKIVGNSFYNKDDELIFWYDEEQRQRLQEKYDSENAEKKAWAEWAKVKDQLNETTFITIPYLVAEHMLECVPPKRMDKGRWLVGEAYDLNAKGEYTYLECRQVSKGNWEAKYTSINEYDKK